MKLFFTTWSILLGLVADCQDSLFKKTRWDFSGYVKELAWVGFDKNFETANLTTLLHNRLIVKWNPPVKMRGRVEVRNRLFWGDDVRLNPLFKQQLRTVNEAVNLSTTWFSSGSVLMHSNVERLWLEYRATKWNIRAGRQRINWGLANTWNPNDIYNAYNFLDFDYEERPGTDAVKWQYLISDRSNIELALSSKKHDRIAAAKYATHAGNYDLQGIAGRYHDMFTLGGGWAGSLADLGFKGEAQWYAANDSGSRFTATVESDYVFKNNWYLCAALLYNSRGLHAPLTGELPLVFEPSPRSLMPAKWNVLVNASKEISPLLNAGITTVYAPQVNMVIFFPSCRYNLRPNLDIDLFWQSFFVEKSRFQALAHTGTIRLKWSF